MLVEVKVPVLAESIADATLLEWHKKEGERVQRGDNLIDLETDKVTLEVAAPDGGVLKAIHKQTGDTVVTGELLAVIDTDGVAEQSVIEELDIHADSASEPAVTAGGPSAVGAAPAPEVAPTAETAPPPGPAARKLLAEAGVSPTEVPASGRGGRVTKGDVITYLENKGRVESAPLPAPAAGGKAEERLEERVAMSRLRRRAAERLLAAQHENAILTTVNEIDMQPVKTLRQRVQEDFEATYGYKLGFMPFFVKAVVNALQEFPVVNAAVDGEDIIYHHYHDLGIAVGSPRGLVVPVLRDADKCSFAEIEASIREFSEKARDATLSLADLTGGTFTITNGGVFGSLLSTPILNPPQSAILGMHAIKDRPVAEQGQVVIRPMMYVALSYDHRIIDGREAVQFLVSIKKQLEDPARMLIGI